MKSEKRRLYFAYGANTNIRSMVRRCPDARPVAPCKLDGWKLVFRHFADVQQEKGRVVHGALWRISESDEKALDMFEGYPRLYVKALVRVHRKGRTEDVMFYVMRDRRWVEPPSMQYEQTLREGYEQFALPQEQIDLAIAHAEQHSVAARHQLTLFGWDEEPVRWEQEQEPPVRLHELPELPPEHRKGGSRG